MKLLRVALMLAVFAAVGCNKEEPTGPSAADFNEKRAALKEKAAASQQSGGKRKVAKSAPRAKGKAKGKATAPAFGMVERDYVFDPTGKRDPFRNFKWERPDRLRDTALLTPLEQFDLSQLSLVAVVWKTGNARALVQDPSGESYIVAEGARMGKNDGTITTINDNMVRVKETYVDFLGRETTKDIELRMRGNEGG